MENSRILRNHSASEIMEAIEANYIEYFTHYWNKIKDPPDVDIYVGPDMVRIYTGLPYAIYNQVTRVKFEEEDVERKVAKVIDFFRQRDRPFYWVIGPSTKPENLGDILIDQGLSKIAWVTPAMAVDLRSLNEN
jgi:hypothetical protein